MKRIILVAIATLLLSLGLSAANRVSSRTASMDAPDGYTYNKELSESLDMEVFAPADATGAISFGQENDVANFSASALATMLANTLMSGGEMSELTTDKGQKVYMARAKDGQTVVTTAGDKDARAYTIIIFSGAAAAQAPALLKTLVLR